MQKKSVCILSGGFDPIHPAHIAMITEAAKIYDHVVVGINSDAWLIRKKGINFLPREDRMEIVRHIKGVDRVIAFDDTDNTASSLVNICYESYQSYDIIFGNGGDRVLGKTVPEEELCKALGIKMVDGLGGHNKGNSSSWILNRYYEWARNQPQEAVQRRWGSYQVLHEDSVKVKRLNLEPGQSISRQLHHHRSEHWIVESGAGTFEVDGVVSTQAEGSSVFVPACATHKITNSGSIPLLIIEVQTGKVLEESDIVRFEEIVGEL